MTGIPRRWDDDWIYHTPEEVKEIFQSVGVDPTDSWAVLRAIREERLPEKVWLGIDGKTGSCWQTDSVYEGKGFISVLLRGEGRVRAYKDSVFEVIGIERHPFSMLTHFLSKPEVQAALSKSPMFTN